jgi:hypothetical protein
MGNCPEAVVRQATISLYSQVWKSFGGSLPELYCIDLAEAYVMQESVSLRILREKKRYDLRSPNRRLHEKPSVKGRMGEKMVLILVPGSQEHLASRKRIMCA